MTIKFVIAEGNDLTFHATKRDAETYMEAIDVIDGIYKGYDDAGRLLTIRPKGPASEIALAETEPTHADELRTKLVRYLKVLGRESRTDDLESLLKDVETAHEEIRSRRMSFMDWVRWFMPLSWTNR